MSYDGSQDFGKSFWTNGFVKARRVKDPLELLELMLKNLRYAAIWYFDRRFDRRWKTSTSGNVALSRLTIASENKDEGVYYEPTPERTFKRLLATIAGDRRTMQFIDFGAGKGRTLISALAAGFGSVTGVEFSNELCNVARANLEQAERHFPGQSHAVHCLDAAKFRPEPRSGGTLYYFYNPFSAEVLRKVVSNIRSAHADAAYPVWIIYYNAHHDRMQVIREELPGAHLVKHGRFRFDFGSHIRRPHAVFRFAGQASR